MWPFGEKFKTLSDAVRSGDIKATRKMLASGANPNKPAPNDDICPIHYAVNIGPEMVQLLIDYGADVNTPNRLNSTALAMAESQGYTDVAIVLRKAGASFRTSNDKSALDPRLRIELELKIPQLVFFSRLEHRYESPELIAGRIEKKINLVFPHDMPSEMQEKVRREVRSLILREMEKNP